LVGRESGIVSAETIEGAFSTAWEKRASALGPNASRDSACAVAREALADVKLAGTALFKTSAARGALHLGLDAIIEATPGLIEAVECRAQIVDDPTACKLDGPAKGAVEMANFLRLSQIVLLVTLLFLAFVSRTTEAAIGAIIALLVLLAELYIHRFRGEGASLLGWVGALIAPEWARSVGETIKQWWSNVTVETSAPPITVKTHVTIKLDRLATGLRRLVAGLERVVVNLDGQALEVGRGSKLGEISEPVLRFLQLVADCRNAADELLQVIEAEFDNVLDALDVEVLQWTPDAPAALWQVVEIAGLPGPETSTPAIRGRNQYLPGIVSMPPRECPP
jgi:hypothetical protein